MERPYERIACCIDRDGMVDHVVQEGLRLASEGSEVQIVHVIAPPQAIGTTPFAYVPPIVEMRDEAEAWLAGVTRDIPGATSVLLDGSPARELCAWARSSGVDLIVAAADRGLVERAILGGFASHVAYHAPCSVLLVHRPVEVSESRGVANQSSQSPSGNA